MNLIVTLRGIAASALVALGTVQAFAQDDATRTDPEEVRAEVAEAMDAIAAYSEQEREQALIRAREALDRLDAEIELREQKLREEWAEMSNAARTGAEARLRDLREARNRLGERYGALQAGTRDAWDELKSGFGDAWTAFSDAWSAADEEAPVD